MNPALKLKNYFLLLCCLLLWNSWILDAQAPGPKVHIVEIRKMKFEPSMLLVESGDTVLWINKDLVPHNVTAEKGWASPLLPPEKSWKKVIFKSSAYYCNLHPVMKGKVKVE